jgi:hypothetical protein
MSHEGMARMKTFQMKIKRGSSNRGPNVSEILRTAYRLYGSDKITRLAVKRVLR